METLNYINGMLVPEGNKCMCCGKEITENEKANYTIPLYKEIDRTNLLVAENIKYRKIGVMVTRCSNCKKIQEKAESIPFLFSFSIGLIIAVIGLVLYFSGLWILGFIFIPIGIITGILLKPTKGEDRATDYLEKKKVLSKENAVVHYKEVAELIRDGWCFSEPGND